MATPLSTLRSRLSQEHFDDGKLTAVSQLASTGFIPFPCSELAPLLSASFPFGDARLTALRTLAPFLTDAATGASAITAVFKFEGERSQAGAILASAAPRGFAPAPAMGGFGGALGGRPGLAEALQGRLSSEHFDDGKLTAVQQTVSIGGWAPISCGAAAGVLGKFPFGETRISALRVLAPCLSDIPTGQAQILSTFKFEGERSEAGGILASAAAAAHPPPHQAYPPSYPVGGMPAGTTGSMGMGMPAGMGGFYPQGGMPMAAPPMPMMGGGAMGMGGGGMPMGGSGMGGMAAPPSGADMAGAMLAANIFGSVLGGIAGVAAANAHGHPPPPGAHPFPVPPVGVSVSFGAQGPPQQSFGAPLMGMPFGFPPRF